MEWYLLGEHICRCNGESGLKDVTWICPAFSEKHSRIWVTVQKSPAPLAERLTREEMKNGCGKRWEEWDRGRDGGDVPSVELWPVQQAQFIPLTEVLCLLISEMNRRKLLATQDTVRKKLSECYDKMPVPSPEIIHKSLTHLMNEGKIVHNGVGYHITKGDEVPPDTTDAESVATFATTRTKKKEKDKEKDKLKEYLIYKDGVLTRHTFPEEVNENLGIKVRPESGASRPLSYPANPTLASIPEDRTAFQRSISMRERRSPQKKSKFERTSSMRLPNDISYYDQGYLTSDSEAKPSCLGRLLGKAVQKKPKAAPNNNNQPNHLLQTFSAQFPPSDIHDPFFNYNHWMKKTPEKLGTNRSQNNGPDGDKIKDDKERSKTLEAVPTAPKHTYSPKSKRKSLPKDLSNVKTGSHYALDHGRLTQTAKTLQQKYQDGQEESMPESEVEFLKPTKMYDGKHRTKAVADQKPTLSKSPQKNPKDSKGDKINHYFSSMDRAQPLNPKPYQGLTSESSLAGSDSELEMNPRKKAAAVEKRLLKQRHADLLRERRQGRLFASQRADAPGSTSNLGGQQPREEVPSRLQANGRSAVEEYEKRKGYGPRRCSSEEDVSDLPRLLPEDSDRQLVAQSRKICLAFQDSGQMVVKTSTPHSTNNQAVENREGNNRFLQEPERPRNASNLDKVVMRKHDLIKKRPHSSHETFYKDEEIDKLLEEELQNEKVNHNMRYKNEIPEKDKNSNSRYPEILDHCHRPGNDELNQSLDRQSFTSTSTVEYNSQGDPPAIIGHTVSPDASTINGSYASLANGQRPLHHRMESLSSSTGDSGFNSPRSSVNNGFNSNGFPSKQTSPEGLTVRSNSGSSSSIPVLVRPIPRRAYSNTTAVAKVMPTDSHLVQKRRPMSSTSDQSSSSDLTVKCMKDRRRSGSDRDGNSSSSEKSSHSSRSQQRLTRVKSFEVIGTV
ncbi:uncharacterized protein LOC135157540 [Lytechinus pictus]|uniref:uncharacterized protein LOC135157540 n=1 Tax=Lytechinus pictus TaxID=7653 RepID=UPI0030B9DB9E